ncbi:ABC-type multidrug transport system, ATPase component [Anaerolinea thermolimosa]|nr:ABC-type multidrug transport system, ATPase component [Anaerolinea thermolimosa]
MRGFPDGESMIVAEELTKIFDDFLAVDRISLFVPSGKVMVLLGKNGAGKTTTVRMLTSILRPSSGSARVAGFDVVKQAEKVRASVGVLTEHHGLYGRMNTEEYLQFFGSLYGLSARESMQRAVPLLERFDLQVARKKRLSEFSKGMRQKLALVRALLHDPPVLLLDEPTSAMDPESARSVRDAIVQLRKQGRTVLLCTHNLAEAEELADLVAIIHGGRILIQETPEKVKEILLGAPEFEVKLARPLDAWPSGLPAGVTLRESDGDRARFYIESPAQTNPHFLRWMLEQHLEVISFQEVPRSLEQAFLELVKERESGEVYA